MVVGDRQPAEQEVVRDKSKVRRFAGALGLCMALCSSVSEFHRFGDQAVPHAPTSEKILGLIGKHVRGLPEELDQPFLEEWPLAAWWQRPELVDDAEFYIVRSALKQDIHKCVRQLPELNRETQVEVGKCLQRLSCSSAQRS